MGWSSSLNDAAEVLFMGLVVALIGLGAALLVAAIIMMVAWAIGAAPGAMVAGFCWASGVCG